MRRVEELSQRMVLGRVELPQITSPALARKNSAEEHNLDHIDKLDFLAYHVLDTCLSPVSSSAKPQAKPFSCQEVSRMGTPDRKSGVAAQLVPHGLVM